MAEDKSEIKKEVKERKIILNFWMIASIILLILLIVTIIFYNSITGLSVAGDVGKDKAAQNVLSLINNYLVEEGSSATLESVEEVSGIYQVNINYKGNSIDIYLTKDSGYIDLGSGMTSYAILESTLKGSSQTQEPQEIPKSSKPEVELYVMSFCPYGVQAENAMAPVVGLLAGKAEIEVKFIVNVQGDSVEDISSLHGQLETEEDLRQLCIAKYYLEKFWDYISDINENCYPNYRTEGALDECWKNTAGKLSLDINKIETCAYGSEGINMIKENEADSDALGVTGSPTLIINGVKYQGSRTSEGYKTAICSAFTTAPEECDIVLSETSSTSSGSC